MPQLFDMLAERYCILHVRNMLTTFSWLSKRHDHIRTAWETYVDHIAKERWGPPLVDADWQAFCQALYKGIEGEDWRELYDANKEMSRAVGFKKPQEAQKAKAFQKMKAAKDAGAKTTSW